MLTSYHCSYGMSNAIRPPSSPLEAAPWISGALDTVFLFEFLYVPMRLGSSFNMVNRAVYQYVVHPSYYYLGSLPCCA
jgi:hypothetical protein